MKANKGRIILLALTSLATAATAFAFSPVPKASAKALGVTRGKSFSSGAVFVNGKFLEPPYVVERWGTGIRINKTPVTGQVVSWNEFLKTQPGVKVTKVEPKDEAPAPVAEEPAETNAVAEAAEAPAPADSIAKAESLDEIFDEGEDKPKDEGKEKAKGEEAKSEGEEKAKSEGEVEKAKSEGEGEKAKPKTKAKVVYSIDGPFVPNEASKALVTRINATRTEIDKILRSGGFVFFGDKYERVVGDRRILQDLLVKLPEVQMNAKDVEDFCTKARAAQLDYLNDVLRWELYKNRVDYLKLRKLREQMKEKDALGL